MRREGDARSAQHRRSSPLFGTGVSRSVRISCDIVAANRRLRLYPRHEVETDHVLVNLYVNVILDVGSNFADAVLRIADVIGVTTYGSHSSSSMTSLDAYSTKVVSYTPLADGPGTDGRGVIELGIPTSAGIAEAGIPLLLATAMYASVYDFIREYQILDVQLPSTLLSSLPGPTFDQARWFVETGPEERLGLILKPRYSSSIAAIRTYIRPFVEAGINYVQDDELTVATSELALGRRVEAMVASATRSGGTRVPVIVNITGRYGKALQNARIALDAGAAGVMVNIVTMGFDVLQTIATTPRLDIGVVANAIGRNIVSGGPHYKISATVLCKLARACGADAIYTSSFSGDVRNSQQEAAQYRCALADPFGPNCKKLKSAALMSGGIGVREIVENRRIYDAPLMLSLGSKVVNLVEQGHRPDLIMTCVRGAVGASSSEAREANDQIQRLASLSESHRLCLQALDAAAAIS